MPGLHDILAVILGGGRGSRLYPLTKMRSKPAVPIAAKYRLIDVPISNCINSGINRIAVLTQFNSVSLHRHIAQTYAFDPFHTGWVQIWAAEQTMESADWYQGTADAVRKQVMQIQSTQASYVLILAGDHLYRMDYSEMARFHWEHDADITVAVQPISRSDVTRFGVMKRDPDCRLIDFAEKPKDLARQERMVSRDDPEKPFLGSMGIYLFKTSVLLNLLNNHKLNDFGGDIIPSALSSGAVYGYDFNDFWADIGTIESFYETNLALTSPNPPFDFYDPDNPIFTRSRFLPGSVIEESVLRDVLMGEGCIIKQAEIDHSIIGLRSQIQARVRIKDSILMGADYYVRPDDRPGSIPIGIGEGCQIERAIIDKNARLGAGVIIRPFPKSAGDIDRESWFVRDGIVVVPKNAILPPGTVISP